MVPKKEVGDDLFFCRGFFPPFFPGAAAFAPAAADPGGLLPSWGRFLRGFGAAEPAFLRRLPPAVTGRIAVFSTMRDYCQLSRSLASISVPSFWEEGVRGLTAVVAGAFVVS